MVVGEGTQLVPSENVCVADEEKILCIVRDMVDTQSVGRKRSLNLPVSTKCGKVVEEIAKQNGYQADTISVHYEKQLGDELKEVAIDECPDASLGSICMYDTKHHNFCISEKDGVLPLKTEVDSPPSYETATSLKINYSVGNYMSDTYTPPSYSGSLDSSYSYASAVMKSETGYVGLVNQAMTCYLNSLLQTLFMTPEFKNAVYRWEFDGMEDDNEDVKSIPYQLQKLFLQLQTSKKRAVETTDLTKSFGWDSSEVWQQHDVQELCRVMFDALELKWKNTDQANLINELYQGHIKDYVKCLECDYESARIAPYLDIPLVIRPFGSNHAYESVEEALNAFIQPETLDDNNQYFCEKCNKKCNAHKGLKFMSFPYLLTLQLKRFDFDYSTMHRIKLNDKMSFPDILNLNYLAENNKATRLSNGCVNAIIDDTCQEKLHSTDVNTDTYDDVDEGIDIDAASSGMSSNSEASSTTSEATANDKNAKELEFKGPYIYELFSIMIHSGSAAGGHYYVYIKSFKDGQWYCFNDQHVSKITYDDIRKTYGGSSSSRGYYSSTFASSTNAYMLMYRQLDKENNASAMTPAEFPKHLTNLLQTLQEKEEAERRQREIDKSTCKIKLFCQHPKTMNKMDAKFEIHKDKTLTEAIEAAYKLFDLETVISLDCCRLVKYDDYSDSLERSFENENDSPMGKVLGGVKSSYSFDLLLETKRPEQEFLEYKPGGVTVKIYLVDLKKEEIHPPVNVRAYHVQTIQEFKNHVSQVFDIPVSHMRCILERFHNDLRQLNVPNKTLKAEGFFKTNKVFVEYSGDTEENSVLFPDSKLYKLLDRFQNTIRISVNLPPLAEVELFCKSAECNWTNHQLLNKNISTKCSASENTSEIDEGISDSDVYYQVKSMSISRSHSDPSLYRTSKALDLSPLASDICQTGSSTGQSVSSSQETSTSAEFSLNANYNASSDGQSISPDDSFVRKEPAEVSDCDRCLPSPEDSNKTTKLVTESTENWDLEYESSDHPVKDTQEEAVTPRYFKCTEHVDEVTEQRGLTVFVDKRITLGDFKKELQQYVGTKCDYFKVYRVYPNNQEFESIKLSENLAFLEDGKLNIKLGRALKPGEYRVKVYQLLVNDPEVCKFLIETIFAKRMSVLESKNLILAEIKQHCKMDIPLDRCRLRKKSFKAPGTIYIDQQLYDTELAIFPNWEVYLEVLSGPEILTTLSQLALFTKRWRPSTHEVEPFKEVVLSHQTVEELKQKLSEISSIPVENVEFAKGRGNFPCEVGVLDIHTELDWNPETTTLNTWPLYICDDGQVIYYRDKTEPLGELSEERKKELQKEENSRLSRSTYRISYSPRKEKALKIYTDEQPSNRHLPSPELD